MAVGDTSVTFSLPFVAVRKSRDRKQESSRRTIRQWAHVVFLGPVRLVAVDRGDLRVQCGLGPGVFAGNTEHGRDGVIAERHQGSLVLPARAGNIDVAARESVDGDLSHRRTSDASNEGIAGIANSSEELDQYDTG